MTKITVRGDVDPRAVEQLTRCAKAGDAPLAAACADSHVGYSLNVGGVVGYRDYVSPSGVGYDIGCGNMAVRTDVKAGELLRTCGAVGTGRPSVTELSRIMDEIQARVDFGIGTRPGNEVDHPVLEKIRNADYVPQRGLFQLARDQLGTVGSGNHYVDLFVDENGDVWIGVHFGSRGFGHKTASGFLAIAEEEDRRAEGNGSPGRRVDDWFHEKSKDGEMDAEPTLFHVKRELGQAYIAAMQLAGEYAYAGREVVVQRVLDILGAVALETVHNHHNFAWREDHFVDGFMEDLWVVRKGATPAFPGQKGFVGATMGEPAVILEGSCGGDVALKEGLLYSTVHGAGRVMSRNQAAGKWKKVWECGDRDCSRVIETSSPNETPGKGACPDHPNARPQKRRKRVGGRINWTATTAELAAKGIELRGAGADEAPLAYKRLDEVLAHHAGTVKILHTLQPIGVVMAGADTRDPYKD